ncbi:MFS transporter [Planktothrix sp. FACHB-1355]|uniref:MFS transporter n=1 Tax=Aerosakkonema funiforme FACHB-1375 TaxID=2949571 RepID=A0A926VHN4_9CYAN|nr:MULTISPECIES: MFS transporter [Oscillatoriales]MBD2183934.1 MFS transporter [Aerosakkonema funiforme FACHB-1375]MBD3560352.1 MFS transporter [Planktothrix sp. FACHB-1355]
MKFLNISQWRWLPGLNPQVGILAVGRFLSEVGSGFTLFYAPIFFANLVNLSATQVGIGLGSASISGVLGRLLGGSFADSRFWGRRRTLLLSAAISAIASLVMALSDNFSTFVVANLLMGLGMGLYWPATEAAVADLTQPEHRQEAFAIVRFADNFGLGVGIILGGMLIGTTGAYRALFVIDAISFVVFFAVIYFAIAETYKPTEHHREKLGNWETALRDRRLVIFVLGNIIFTTYVSQLHSTIPLYFSKFVPVGNSKVGFATITISALFTWHTILATLCLIPISRLLRRFSHPHALTVSALLWAVGFSLIWVTGVAPAGQLTWAILAMGVTAIAIVFYTPSASAFVADIAPESRRGLYLSINSLCWAVGYAVGPPLGGWAMDRSSIAANSFWLGLAFSVVIVVAILQYLNRILNN